MGCSPPPARIGCPGVLAGSCVTDMERGGRGGGRGTQAQGVRGEQGRSHSWGEVGSGSA